MSRTIHNASVAVVGGAGFLGSHLVNHLIEDRGCQVLVIDNLVAGRREFVHPRAVFCHHDITLSEDHLLTLFLLHDVEYVFNYAAYPYIPDSFDRPLHVANVNFFGAMKVINAAHLAGAKGILQVSSAEIYGGLSKERTEHYQAMFQRLATSVRDTEETPYGLTEEEVAAGHKMDENTIVKPHSTYGASKAAVDFYVQARWREAKVPCIALRQFNCVGERETHPYVVPEIISQLAAQQDYDIPMGGDLPTKERGRARWMPEVGNEIGIVRLGNNSFRDLMYAGDAVRMAVELLEKGGFGEVYNLGSEAGIKIYDLAKLVGKLMGFEDVRIEVDKCRVRPWEIWHLLSSNEKFWRLFPDGMPSQTRHALMGGTTLEAALTKTINWYNENGRKWPWEK